MTTLYKFKAYFTNAGVGTVQDPAPTCTVINMADDTKLADAQATTASTNMPGLYSYTYSGADGLDCVALFATTDTGCDVKQLASYVSEKITTNLNADVAGVEAKIDAIKEKTDNLPADPADDSDIDVQLAAIKAETAAILVDTGTTLDTKITTIDGIVDAIKLKTDLIPATPAQAGEYTAAIAAVQADLNNPDQYKADVSALATTAHVQEVEDKVDAIDTDTVMSFMIDGFTFEQIVQIMASVLAGKLTRSGDTLTFKDLADTVNRVVVETDENKQRTGITYTV